MGYVPLSGEWAVLRDPNLLESAMRERDLNGRELASTVHTSPQTISQLRKGDRARVNSHLARRLEKTLRVEAGTLFRHDHDPAGALV